ETLALAALTSFFSGVSAQEPPPAAPRSQVAGMVTAVDAPNNQISLTTDKGEAISIATTEKTLVLHMPPGETDPKRGNKMLVSSLASGDRVVAVVRQTVTGQNTLHASSLIVRSKAV